MLPAYYGFFLKKNSARESLSKFIREQIKNTKKKQQEKRTIVIVLEIVACDLGFRRRKTVLEGISSHCLIALPCSSLVGED